MKRIHRIAAALAVIALVLGAGCGGSRVHTASVPRVKKAPPAPPPNIPLPTPVQQGG